MNTKSVLIGLVAFIAVAVAVSVLLTAGQKPEPKVAVYSAESRDRPTAQVPEKNFDFGQIKVEDVKQKEFTLTNTGTQPLQILNVNSSCGCTAGQIIYRGQTSKEFGMHAQSGYVTQIEPGDSAQVRVTYRPAIMPVSGPVEREVYVTTNDPQNERLVFAVKAVVK